MARQTNQLARTALKKACKNRCDLVKGICPSQSNKKGRGAGGKGGIEGAGLREVDQENNMALLEPHLNLHT